MLQRLMLLIASLIIVSCSEDAPSVQKICKEDRLKFCQEVLPGDGRLNDCMRTNRSKFTSACQAALNSADMRFDKAFMPTMNLCTEHETLCSHVPKYGARRINCLKKIYLEEPLKLSPNCRDSLAKIIHLIPPVSR